MLMYVYVGFIVEIEGLDFAVVWVHVTVTFLTSLSITEESIHQQLHACLWKNHGLAYGVELFVQKHPQYV